MRPCGHDHPVAPTRKRVTLTLVATSAVLCLAAVLLTATTPGEGANIGAGFLVLGAMATAVAATVLTVQQQTARRRDGSAGLGRRTLLRVAVVSVLAAVASAAVGQWPMAGAALIPALVAVFHASRQNREA